MSTYTMNKRLMLLSMLHCYMRKVFMLKCNVKRRKGKL